MTVTTKSSDLGKVELELVLQPIDSVSRTASQDSDKIIAGEVTSLWADSATKRFHMGMGHVRIS